MASLFRQIVQSKPPIEVLNLEKFSGNDKGKKIIGEHILESLLDSDIQTITDLNLSMNREWFKYDWQEEKGYIYEW